MKKISLFLKIILLTAVLAGGFYFVKVQGSIKGSGENQLEEKGQEIAGSVRGVTNTIGQQTQDLTERAKEINKHVSRVLGSYIQPATEKSEEKINPTEADNSESEAEEENQNENQDEETNNNSENLNNNEASEAKQSPIYEKTLEYGRYLYCKQVVKDYETQN